MKATRFLCLSGRSTECAYVIGLGADGAAQCEMRETPIMSRMDQIDTGVVVENEAEEDADIVLWNKMGRAAMFFCIWSAMAIPVLLIIAVR